MRRVVMVTGMQAAGKTTIGRLLAARLTPPAAALDGDVFHRMVESGNVDMTPDLPPKAVRQVELRYQAAALVANHYAHAGFDFVYTDIVSGAGSSMPSSPCARGLPRRHGEGSGSTRRTSPRSKRSRPSWPTT